jgi:HPt (histidine-containing phosphotransfer) domain-containing protein
MNIKKLSEIHGLTVEEFSGILDVFIDTAKIDIEKIRSAVHSGDLLSAGKAAHSLKGAAGNLGFTKLSEMARAVEIDAENNHLEKIKSALPLLAEELDYISSQVNTGV